MEEQPLLRLSLPLALTSLPSLCICSAAAVENSSKHTMPSARSPKIANRSLPTYLKLLAVPAYLPGKVTLVTDTGRVAAHIAQQSQHVWGKTGTSNERASNNLGA
ncbi:hypothetical protein ONS95_014743 [Cadophora gregata]|uniref:uncharacterized protein n=1 Tax=Cadophora gregata TaxID=51156 RepID=UPI0026DDB531|nr:uncharacterized protein ONS95_014743 [Cadophora gregata]KAK0113034.1 hypothetical protein ONS95_014743 [Cadophora gregata]KAK0125155.1 hypothetical protein ONS96_009018 [Cadophora gregata f. sp. sojae]